MCYKPVQQFVYEFTLASISCLFVANRAKQGSQEWYFKSKAKLSRLKLVKNQLLIKKQKRSFEATVEAKKLSTNKGIQASGHEKF